MNTLLTLTYRDAENYKAFVDVVLQGEFTREDIKSIKSNLHDGEHIIANQVGLPSPSDRMAGYDSFPNNAIDHVWTEFPLESLDKPNEHKTNLNHTINMTASAFAKAVAAQKWDVLSEWQRMETQT